jgi:hypothetical protein
MIIPTQPLSLSAPHTTGTRSPTKLPPTNIPPTITTTLPYYYGPLPYLHLLTALLLRNTTAPPPPPALTPLRPPITLPSPIPNLTSRLLSSSSQNPASPSPLGDTLFCPSRANPSSSPLPLRPPVIDSRGRRPPTATPPPSLSLCDNLSSAPSLPLLPSP